MGSLSLSFLVSQNALDSASRLERVRVLEADALIRFDFGPLLFVRAVRLGLDLVGLLGELLIVDEISAKNRNVALKLLCTGMIPSLARALASLLRIKL